MRTKVLLCAAALAASLASSMAQNVYSLNVVGYVNITLPANAFSMVANPLSAVSTTLPDGNNITNLFQTLPDSSTVQTWDYLAFGGAGDFSAPLTFIAGSGPGTGWQPTGLEAPPGKGLLIYNNGPARSITFIGEVVQGPYTVATLHSFAFEMVGSPAPIGGYVTNSTTAYGLGLVPVDSDTVQKWDPAAFSGAGDFTAPDTFIAGSGPGTGWQPGTLQIGPADGFLYFRNGATTTWQSNFTVQ